jgi:hypothetical protein
MTTFLEKANRLVIEQTGGWHLENYLRVLHDTNEDFWLETLSGRLDYWSDKHKVFSFNLTTGAPATEADAEAFIKLITE